MVCLAYQSVCQLLRYQKFATWQFPPSLFSLDGPFHFGIPESCCPCFIRLVPSVYRTQLGSGILSPSLKQTPDTLPPLCRSVPSSLTPSNLLTSTAGAVHLSLSSIFPWSQQPASGHPRIVGADIHTLPDGMNPDQKPRLPQR